MSKRYAGGIVSAVFKPLDPHGDLNPLFIVGGEGQGAMGLNLGGTVYRSSPVQIGASTDWYRGFVSGPSIRAGAIKQNGTMWVWGNSENGQLGDNTIIARSSPVQVGALTTWSQMTIRQNTSLALKTDGSLWTWGASNYGQLGQNNLTYRSSPVQVGTSYDWIDADGGHNWTGAIKADGTLWTWGRTQAGQLGQNSGAPSPVDRSSPVQVGADTNWSKIKTLGNSMIAIKTDGSLWVWGYQDQGQLGINNTIPRSSPVQVGALTDWALITSGQYTQMAIKTNGTLWGWGRNDNNGTSIGDNTRINRSSPVQIGSDTNWSKVAMGRHNGSAIKTTGTLWAWGAAATGGATGQNDRVDRSSPVQIGTNTNWAWTAVGGDTEGTQFILATANTQF